MLSFVFVSPPCFQFSSYFPSILSNVAPHHMFSYACFSLRPPGPLPDWYFILPYRTPNDVALLSTLRLPTPFSYDAARTVAGRMSHSHTPPCLPHFGFVAYIVTPGLDPIKAIIINHS